MAGLSLKTTFMVLVCNRTQAMLLKPRGCYTRYPNQMQSHISAPPLQSLLFANTVTTYTHLLPYIRS